MDGRIAQADAEFALQAAVVEAPRFAHERQRRLRQAAFRLVAADPRRTRQGECIGEQIVPVGHRQRRVVAGVIGAVGPPVRQRGPANRRQIVGVDVIGDDVVISGEDRQAATQTVERQAVAGVDAGNAQDADRALAGAAEMAKLALGIEAAPPPAALRPRRARLVNPRAAAVAIDPAGAEVNQVPW